MRTIHNLMEIEESHWIRRYDEVLKSGKLSTKTVKGYRYDLKNFFNWIIETYKREMDIKEISELVLVEYRFQLRFFNQLQAASINRRIQPVRNLFAWAQSEGLVEDNPTKSIPFLKIDKRSTPEGITDKELHALLRTAGQSPHGLGKRNYALIQLFVQTGLSVSEVANVKRGDITIYQRSGSIRICRTKKYKARRIPLNATVRRAITAYLNASPDRTPNDRLFLTKRKTPISVRTLQATIIKLVSRAKISRIKVTARTLRQTFIINYLKKHPGEYKTLVKLLGLKSHDMLIVYIRARKQYDSATSQISRPASYGVSCNKCRSRHHSICPPIFGCDLEHRGVVFKERKRRGVFLVSDLFILSGI